MPKVVLEFEVTENKIYSGSYSTDPIIEWKLTCSKYGVHGHMYINCRRSELEGTLRRLQAGTSVSTVDVKRSSAYTEPDVDAEKLAKDAYTAVTGKEGGHLVSLFSELIGDVFSNKGR